MTRKECAKRAKYSEHCFRACWAFTPMAFGTWGGLGPEAAKLLARVVKRAASWGAEEDREVRANELRIGVGFALMNSVLALLERKNATATTSPTIGGQTV